MNNRSPSPCGSAGVAAAQATPKRLREPPQTPPSGKMLQLLAAEREAAAPPTQYRAYAAEADKFFDGLKFMVEKCARHDLDSNRVQR